jgi:hypothetical protein
VRYYHATNATDAILAEGFRDHSGSYGLQGVTLTGVFISDQPLDGEESVSGDRVFEVELPDDLDLDDYQLVEDGKRYRQWCVPASLLNGFPRRLLTTDEVHSARGCCL